MPNDKLSGLLYTTSYQQTYKAPRVASESEVHHHLSWLTLRWPKVRKNNLRLIRGSIVLDQIRTLSQESTYTRLSKVINPRSNNMKTVKRTLHRWLSVPGDQSRQHGHICLPVETDPSRSSRSVCQLSCLSHCTAMHQSQQVMSNLLCK